MYYSVIFVYGSVVLWDKSWLWDINHCYYGYPYHAVSNDVWWYYMISISFYWALSISQFFDVKRKDFWQMFIHHKATILLMCFSWVGNLTRIGSLVLVLHDCADIFLEVIEDEGSGQIGFSIGDGLNFDFYVDTLDLPRIDAGEMSVDLSMRCSQVRSHSCGRNLIFKK